MGGQSGSIWETFITKSATKLKKTMAENTTLDWIAAYQEGLKAVKEFPAAQKGGHKTIIEVLEAGNEYLIRDDEEEKGPSLAELAKSVRKRADKAKGNQKKDTKSKMEETIDQAGELVALVAEAAAAE